MESNLARFERGGERTTEGTEGTEGLRVGLFF